MQFSLGNLLGTQKYLPYGSSHYPAHRVLLYDIFHPLKLHCLFPFSHGREHDSSCGRVVNDKILSGWWWSLCQLDQLWNQLSDMWLATSVRGFLDQDTWSETTHPKGGQHLLVVAQIKGGRRGKTLCLLLFCLLLISLPALVLLRQLLQCLTDIRAQLLCPFNSSRRAVAL